MFLLEKKTDLRGLAHFTATFLDTWLQENTPAQIYAVVWIHQATLLRFVSSQDALWPLDATTSRWLTF